MKNFTLKSLLSAAVLSVALIACSKKEEDAPKTLTAKESKQVMEDEAERLEQIVEDYQDETKTANDALSSLKRYQNYGPDNYYTDEEGIYFSLTPSSTGGTSGFRSSSSSFRKGWLNKTPKVFNPLLLLSKKVKGAKAIPLNFDDAKGTWEIVLITTTSSPKVQYYCSEYDNNSGRTIYKYLSFEQTDNDGDEVIIKFPSKIYSSYSSTSNEYALCDINSNDEIKNDLIYTISELKVEEVESVFCNTYEDEAEVTETSSVRKLKSVLKKGSKELLSYNVNFTDNAIEYFQKVGNYTLDTKRNFSEYSSTYVQTLKNGSEIIYSNTYKEDILEQIDEDNICDILYSNDYKYYGEYIAKTEDSYTYGSIVIKSSIDYKKALKYAEDEEIDSNSDRDDKEDFLNEYGKHEVYNTAGSKIGTIVFGYSSNGMLETDIEFSDGDNEEILDYSSIYSRALNIYGLQQIIAYEK